MNLKGLDKRTFAAAFRRDLGSAIPEPGITEAMRWIWQEVVEPAQQEISDLRDREKDRIAARNTMRAFIWNVHEIRRRGTELFAFYGDTYCHGSTPEALLEAYRKQVNK